MRAASFGWVVLAYVVALFGAAAVMGSTERLLLVEVALADVLATGVVFAFSALLRNASVYDPYWSVAPVPIGLVYGLTADGANPVRRGLVLVLVALWAIRLTANWAVGWGGLVHEDWRYRDLAAKTGRAWPLVNLFGVHLVPTAIVYLGCLPLWAALRSPAPLGPLDAVAAAVTIGAIVLETVSDLQLRAFRRTPSAEAVLDRGLWAWSRHPNYLGEIGFWLGLALFAAATGLDAMWTWIGVVAMVGLFLGISIPLIERRMVARRPGYAAVQNRIPMLVPWKRP